MKQTDRIGVCARACVWLVVAAGCSSGGGDSPGAMATVSGPSASAGTGATPGPAPGPAPGGGMAPLPGAGAPSAPMTGSAGMGGSSIQPGAGSGGGDMLPAMQAGAGATAGSNAMPSLPSGPEDGDPSQPVVAVSGVACGPNPSLLGLTSTNAQIGGRDVHVAYPCNKRKGAPVTFILNLHGTMPDETLKLYQVAYFSANTLASSHNFIVVSPKSVVAQWGNGDNGVDEPHLMEVIDWVYTTFADFDIRSMWVGGHSWGAMYTSTFACKAELADKVKGVIIMSGLPTVPACASRLAVINTVGEVADAAPVNQGDLPAMHGCGAAEMHMVGNNRQTLWPDCQPGFVHANYLMLGKGHIDYMDPEVVTSIGDLIKSARP